jgi:hypothetical protein
LAGLVWEVHTLAKLAWIKRAEIFLSFGPLLVVILAFVGFVFYNGSIVVGKLHHSLMQNICTKFWNNNITFSVFLCGVFAHA